MNDSSFYEVIPLVIFMVAFYGVLGVAGIVNYILTGIGIMRLSESRGIPNGWLGFIPIANQYQLGKIGGEIELGKHKIKNPGLWMALLPAIFGSVFFAFYFIFMFSMIQMSISSPSAPWEHSRSFDSSMIMFIILFFIAYLVFIAVIIFIWLLRSMVFYKIFSCYDEGQRPMFHTALCIFVPLASAILMFNYGRKPMIYPPEYMRNYPPQYPPYGGYPSAGQYGYQPYVYAQPPVNNPQPPAAPVEQPVPPSVNPQPPAPVEQPAPPSAPQAPDINQENLSE